MGGWQILWWLSCHAVKQNATFLSICYQNDFFSSSSVSLLSSSPSYLSPSSLSSSTSYILVIVTKMHFFFLIYFYNSPSYNAYHHYDHHHHHLYLLLHHHRSFLFTSGIYHVSTEEYLSLLVLSEFSWTPVLIQTEQQDQHFQFPQPSTGRGLRKWVCRWWEQHFWGQPEAEGLFVSSQELWSTQQQREPVQLLVTSPTSAQWDQAQLCWLQWGCVPGGWEFTPIVTCGALSA